MRKIFNKKKTKFTVIFLAAALACIILSVVLAVTLYKNYDIKSISVNGSPASISKETAQVQIKQTETVSIYVETYSDIQVKIFKDEDFTQDLQDFNNIQISGFDTTLYITTGTNNKIKKTYTLNIKNEISEHNIIDFKINGVEPQLFNDSLTVTLPDITQACNIAVPSTSFFSYIFYYDREHKTRIDELSNFTLPTGQTVIYLDVYNVNFNGIYKSFIINFQFIETTDGIINELYVNGIKGTITRTEINADVERANIISLELKVSDKSNFEIFKDRNLTSQIEDIHRIQNLNLSGKPLKYYIKVIAANGTELIYTLTVNYILDSNTDISSLKINDTLAFIEENEINVLIERAKSLTLTAECASPYAKISFYLDNNKTIPLTTTENIDITTYTKQKYQLFALVTAEDGNEKFYSVLVNFVLSNKAELLDLKANNQTANLENNSTASLQYIGTTDTFKLFIESIKVSKYATYKIFNDSDCTTPIDYSDGITITTNHQSFYIKITAEDNSLCIVTLSVNLISNDNDLKSIVINEQEFIITNEESILTLENNTKIQINEILYDHNSDIGIFYDSLQTIAVTNLDDINFENSKAQIYIRIIAETGAIKVFSIQIIIKSAPAPIFTTNKLQLSDWQKTISMSELFILECGAYNNNQFDYEVFWNDTEQNTDYISLINEHKFYSLSIVVISPYFSDIVYTKTIEVLPYSLTPITVSLAYDQFETKDLTQKLNISELIKLNSGSYTIGRDFYVEINYPDMTRQVVVDINSQIDLIPGTYLFFINAFNNYFYTQNFGELTVTLIDKDIPTITAPDFIEMAESNTSIKIADLFSINENDYEIILIKTYSNNIESERINCISGIYFIKLQVFYSKGTLEKTIKVEISNISDNTSIDLYLNNQILSFTDNQITIPDLKYNDLFELRGEHYNSRASIALKVNGIATNFEELTLNTGNNTITITVTAESGRSEIYTIFVFKYIRVLPTITTYSKTIKLTKYQNHINIEDFYVITPNDYLVQAKAYYNEIEIRNNIFEIENISKIYSIDIVLTGEFGEISQKLELGVLPYTEIEVRFKSSSINKEDPNYIFSLSDFIVEIIFYGIDSDTCVYELICDEEVFTSAPLAEGEHYFTINIWQDNLLLIGDTRWFNIQFSDLPSSINVTLINNNTIIPNKIYAATLEDYFKVDYALYDSDSLIIRFIYNDFIASRNSFILRDGKNNFTLQIIERLTEQELFSNQYTITCHYICNSESIFNNILLNNINYEVRGNEIVSIRTTLLNEVKLSYSLNAGFSVYNLPETLTLKRGINQLQFYIEENDGSSYTAILNIYNLCELNQFISSVSYGGYTVQNNNLILDANTEFYLENLYIAYNEAEHLQLNKSINKLHDKIFDIRINGKYDNIDIGSIVIRVYIGALQPRLFEIVNKVNGDSILYCGLNEYSLEIFAQAETPEFNFLIEFFSDNYSTSSINCTDLNYGINNLKFTIEDTANAEYQYSLLLTLFPSDMFESVLYNDTELNKCDDYYVVENSNSINENLLAITLKEFPISVTLRSSQVTFNNEIVGYKYSVIYNEIIIQTAYLALANTNSSIICERNSITLKQLGNNILSDRIKIRKSNSTNTLSYTYLITCIYPLTYIADDNFSYYENIGYFVDVDLSYILANESGSYVHYLNFDVFTVSSSFSYTLQIDIELYEITAENAELTIFVGTDIQLYLEETDMLNSYIILSEKISLDIESKEVNIKINSKTNYNLYNNMNVVNELNVMLSYDNGYYIEFNIGLHVYNLKTIIIYLDSYTNDNGEIIETTCVFGEQKINILENASTMKIEYNNSIYNVSIADKILIFPYGTSEATVQIYGYLTELYDFRFKNNALGSEGNLDIINGCILLMLDDDTPTPYALIEVLLV